ncbi:hypothetical protein PoB_003782800 [Plakobranchus ocellatus]|uniref:Uncharacterized protein n=1 Tax=Plakobranchus ocellatus TaxID=259542 RepID=A0AAV4AXU8_9GAST|nr:hypothetical protein PoB_003782800 [Plakobranchus ocellatus]
MCKAPPVTSKTLIHPTIKLRHTHGISEFITVWLIEAVEISAQLRHLDKAFGRTVLTKIFYQRGRQKGDESLNYGLLKLRVAGTN